MFVYVQIPKYTQRKLPEVVSGCRKIAEYKANIQSFNSFLHDNNEQLEFEYIRYFLFLFYVCKSILPAFIQEHHMYALFQ